jgi:ferrous iron transport protein A
METIVKLSEMKPGQEGIIYEYKSNEIFLKLMEMGCVPGEKIQMEKIAPMGDPISVNVAGYHLSLRFKRGGACICEIKKLIINTLNENRALFRFL